MSRICTWTEFRVPESEPIFEIDNQHAPSEARQKWVRVICPLAEAPGFQMACWSRIRERPDTIALCARWASRADLDAFRASPEHAAYAAGISAFGAPLEVEHDDKGLGVIYLANHTWVSCVRVAFPRPLGASERGEVRMLNGLVRPGGRAPGVRYDLPWFESHIAWAAGPSASSSKQKPKQEGEEDEEVDETKTEDIPETLFWFHSWASFDREDEFKRTGTKRFYRKETGEQQLPPEEWFDRSIRNLGAVDWRQEHYFGFKYMPTVFNGEPSTGRFLRNGKVIAGGTVLQR